MQQELDLPLVVDLDGTLIKTDLLMETVSATVLNNPFVLVKLIGWLAKGRSALKAELALQSKLDMASLPYNKALAAWLHQQKSLGRKIILATASHKHLADKVAIHWGLFDEVIATEGDVNLKAEQKREALVCLFGEHGYDYVGNESADLPVWRSARHAYIVSKSSGLIQELSTQGRMKEVFDPERAPLGNAIFKAIRVHQWIKNFLVFVPLLAAFRFTDGHSVLSALVAFLSFGLMASSVYVLNDLSDVSDDRHHFRKRRRPFAAGDLSLLTGWFIWPVLLIAAFILAGVFLPWAFVGVLGAYFVLTLVYSLGLKQIAMLDVLTLAGLYTSRIVAGTVAISVSQSFWMLTFSVFIFLSLAFVKRFSELQAARSNNYEGHIRGRGYIHQDLELVSSMGVSAGYLSVLVLALYIQDAHTAVLYATPKFIWLACPILLYWISRTWLIAHRGEMHDDPIVFAIKDKASWLVGVCFVGVFAMAKLIS